MAKPDSKVQKKCQMRSLSPQLVLVSQGSHWEGWGESPPTFTMSKMHPNKQASTFLPYHSDLSARNTNVALHLQIV